MKRLSNELWDQGIKFCRDCGTIITAASVEDFFLADIHKLNCPLCGSDQVYWHMPDTGWDITTIFFLVEGERNFREV